ncbi:amidohydrolase family protein [Xanthobacter sp. KR7-65]|uniref:amidohydrolase family protein n=1 Tax=Xanthobacter sp. KR7-65 TaxID=3156612 RepID=UPI0032B56EB6
MKNSDRPGRFANAIDCDVHNSIPSAKVLYPYLSEYWQDFMDEAGRPSLETNAYPANSAIAARPDARAADVPPGSDPDTLIAQVLDAPGSRRAILNCLYGVHAIYNEYWAAALATAVNDWMAAHWLARDPRLSASIVIAPQNPQSAAEEIERRAGDRRFVQVLLPARTLMPLGRRFYWPVYEAAARHGLPVCIHAGGGGAGQPPTAAGWPTHYVEEYLAVAQGFQGQLVSLVTEGVFAKLPALTVVFAESGFTWLPALMWRLDKNWKGLRREVPWVDRLPSEIIRDHLKLTLQPLDQPNELRRLVETLDHIGSDEMLLFSTDYPHWQFDDEGPLPLDLSPEAERKLLFANAERTYRFHA